MDDEYALAGVQDPKILVTTARDPSSRLAQFATVSKTDSQRHPRH
jgi:U3 small nucleolar ribonucleoprotein protein IMP4